MTKARIRREMRTHLATLGPAREEKSKALVANITGDPAFASRRHVALFSPLPTEPDVELLWENSALHFCYPRIAETGMEFVAVSKLDELAASPWHPQIREHARADARVVPPAEIEAILVPGLAFTRYGLRLGRGGGYYDRYLPLLSPATLKIGVCFAVQIVRSLPTELHDQRMDAVATEDGIFR